MKKRPAPKSASIPAGRTNFSSGTPWEPLVGYSRAVRVGKMVYVAGTTAADPRGEIVGGVDVYEQAKQAIRNIEEALGKAGASLRDVVRTRIYVTNIEDWTDVGRAHQEAFGGNPPASTLVQVSRLVDPDMRVEIEAEAVISA